MIIREKDDIIRALDVWNRFNEINSPIRTIPQRDLAHVIVTLIALYDGLTYDELVHLLNYNKVDSLKAVLDIMCVKNILSYDKDLLIASRTPVTGKYTKGVYKLKTYNSNIWDLSEDYFNKSLLVAFSMFISNIKAHLNILKDSSTSKHILYNELLKRLCNSSKGLYQPELESIGYIKDKKLNSEAYLLNTKEKGFALRRF